MADSIYKWSLTAGSNDAADSIINWREGQLPDTVNDSARAMMQRIAEWREDMTGNLVTAGTQPAYTVTTKAAFDTLTNGRFLTVRCHATNAAGASTLNVNGLGALSIRKFGVTGDLNVAPGDLQSGNLYQFMYSSAANGGAGGWIIPNPSVATGGGFASGTAIVFAMPASPTGWTKATVVTDCALRLVSGTSGGQVGGSTNFTTVFTSTRTATGTVSDVALTVAQMPVHAHTQQGGFNTGTESADHYHYFPGGGYGSGGRSTGHQHGNASDGNNFVTAGGTLGSGSGLGYKQTVGTSYDDRDHSHTTTVNGNTQYDSNTHYHGVTISGATTNTGSGATHNHTFTSANMNFDVRYVDTIIATKD